MVVAAVFVLVLVVQVCSGCQRTRCQPATAAACACLRRSIGGCKAQEQVHKAIHDRCCCLPLPLILRYHAGRRPVVEPVRGHHLLHGRAKSLCGRMRARGRTKEEQRKKMRVKETFYLSNREENDWFVAKVIGMIFWYFSLWNHSFSGIFHNSNLSVVLSRNDDVLMLWNQISQ